MKMVLVDWIDTGVIHGWRDKTEVRDTCASCQSVGIVVADEEDRITLTLGISDQGLVMDCITIPRTSIKQIRQLRVK